MHFGREKKFPYKRTQGMPRSLDFVPQVTENPGVDKWNWELYDQKNLAYDIGGFGRCTVCLPMVPAGSVLALWLPSRGWGGGETLGALAEDWKEEG